MKTLLTLFVLFFSFNTYGGWFDKTVCVETDAQDRNGIIFLPNQTEPFTGNNLCKYENGQIKLEVVYKNGKENGSWKQWYENGQVKSEVKFVDGIKEGIETIWNKNGTVRSKDQYINGKVIK